MIEWKLSNLKAHKGSNEFQFTWHESVKIVDYRVVLV